MKKAVIYYFSGTGNTKFVAELYKKFLKDYSTETYQIRMKKNHDGKYVFTDFPSPEKFDLTGFGFPVYGFNIPYPVEQFIKKIPVLESPKTAFVFCTSGEGLYANDFSSKHLIYKLSKKGFSFVSDRRFVMPYNLIFRHTPYMVKREALYAEKYAEISCSDIMNGKKDNLYINPLKRFFVPLVRIEWPFFRIHGSFFKVDRKKCISCNKCVSLCPMNNIEVKDGRFVFGHNCAMCTSCAFNCPKDAIKIGILNGWKINGSYEIEKTAKDRSIKGCEPGTEYNGLCPNLYKKYYKKIDSVILNTDKQ